MTGTVDDRYFEWLYSLVGSVRNRNPSRSYWGLTKQLYKREFVWFVPNDDNRVEDGKELRYEFIQEIDFDEVDPLWMDLGSSVLEVLIALARRASFQTDKEADEWFYIFLENLELSSFVDGSYGPGAETEVDIVIERFIFRTYGPDGSGGLFPLRGPHKDQRDVELWYQLASYLLENETL